MFFTRSRQQANSDSGTEIYVSSRAGGAWSEAKKVSLFKDSTISVAHPAISPDGMTLVFVSDAKGGKGGKDLWQATLTGGEWKEIRNLGSDFNTEGDEMFPSFRHDGSLYFSSNGLPGIGGLDIFKATPTKQDGWIVENMGMPVNSNFDDFGISFEGKADKGFFTSNRNEARGYDMIYTFEMPVFEYALEGKVVDENQGPVADAIIRMVSNTGINTKVQAKKDGTFRIRIDKDIECVLLATSRGYLNKSARISTVGAKQSKVYTQNFVLQTIYKPIQMENIFYEFGKWELTPASESGLQALVKILTDNPNITIELSAHTDFVGNNESNKDLSAKRAQSVVDYLIKAGIQQARLTSVGYGEEKPFVVDAATAQKYTFLKENDILTEEFILKLTPEQQEQANQINRRTEFRVVKTTYK
jgi:peptidoglycan-associated lipoprotein